MLISLSRGQVTLVDDADYDWLMQRKWCAVWSTSIRCFYAVCSVESKALYMHRYILGLEFGDPRFGDHIEPSQTLDNRRSNLRIP